MCRVVVATLFLASILMILLVNIGGGIGLFLAAAGVEAWFLSRHEGNAPATARERAPCE